ncbi:MAG: hypothetical protein OEN52_03750 [Gammaproteobacteria bacterium]|nr:hypothetical protein [Gammaproteobacteria bacterium]MDH3560053.1 hypothetical protein [Gammaproteobacteria bacterium]
MNLKANMLSMAVLVIFSLTWSALVQAFFCFSVGAGSGSKHRNRHYSQPPPPVGFGAVAYPQYYNSPVLQSPVARPALVPEAVSPETRGRAARQQIFK